MFFLDSGKLKAFTCGMGLVVLVLGSAFWVNASADLKEAQEELKTSLAPSAMKALPEDIKEAIEEQRKAQKEALRTLNLESRSVGDQRGLSKLTDGHIPSLMKTLAGEPLESLDLYNHPGITKESVSCFKELANLKKLKLSCTNIAGGITQLLAGLPKIEDLNLYGVKITEEDAQALSTNQTLRTLDLSANNLTPGRLEILSHNTHVTSLTLFKNNLEGKAMSSLLNMKQLEIITLTQNPLEDQGAAILAEHPNLKNVTLRLCSMGDNAAWALSKSQTIDSLVLNGNRISPEGVRAFGEDPKTPLKYLELLDNSGLRRAEMQQAAYEVRQKRPGLNINL